MHGINFRKSYLLGEAYESIKERAIQILDKYLGDPNLFMFTDRDKSLTFSTERLVPTFTNRPRVMLMFSNPHPHSIQQGMFLSPNTRGQENLFWPTMEAAGWLPVEKEHRTPGQLAEICLKGEHDGPFDLVFYCYYAFPTGYPEEIQKIFGREFFKRVIATEAASEFQQTLWETDVEAVVTFNKGIFNLVSKEEVDCYVDRLVEGELIEGWVTGVERSIPFFLTFPTSWRFRKGYRQFRQASLERIKNAILCGRNRLDETGTT